MNTCNMIFGLLIVTLLGCARENINPGRSNDSATEILADATVPLETAEDIDTLIDAVDDDRFVLLGEASHGTSEFYTWRAEISRRLITARGFNIIAVEGDWPGLYALNQYILGDAGDTGAREVLAKMDRWPTWMWANEEIVAFAEWLRAHNATVPDARKVRFYGLDVYSLWESLGEVDAYVRTNYPKAIGQLEQVWSCFEPYGSDEYAYARTVTPQTSCLDELTALYENLQQEYEGDDVALFNAIQNARIAVNAERYYTTSVRSYEASWNVRDRHMMETINALVSHHGETSKMIVWAHNTHVGDARATDMAEQGMVNIGELVREAYGAANTFVVGFGTFEGRVLAGRRWEGAQEVMQVPSARRGSWERILHELPFEDLIVFTKSLVNVAAYDEFIGHRAIGVVYHPENEQGNYVPSLLPDRYDAFIFIDRTTALRPIDESPSAGRR